MYLVIVIQFFFEFLIDKIDIFLLFIIDIYLIMILDIFCKNYDHTLMYKGTTPTNQSAIHMKAKLALMNSFIYKLNIS